MKPVMRFPWAGTALGALLWALILLTLAAAPARGQGPDGAWLPTLTSPFVRDTLARLAGRLVFTGNPAPGARADHVRPDTIRLGPVPDSLNEFYVVAHEVGHIWSWLNRADTSMHYVVLQHDAQERVGGYAARSVGEHAAEAFAYAVLILRLPADQREPMLARVEPLVLGTRLTYETIRARLAADVAAR
jgi:hypothetical protein